MIDLDIPHRSTDRRSTEVTGISDLHGLLVSGNVKTLSEQSTHFLTVISKINSTPSFKSVHSQKESNDAHH